MLIRCPECDREVSDIAKSCPHCGFPISSIENVNLNEPKKDNTFYERPTQSLLIREEKPNGKRTFFWVVLVVIGMFAGCGACSTSSEPEEVELTADDFETYDEYVESKRIVPEETTVEETVIEETTEEPQTEIAEIPMEEYIAQCQEYNYKDVLRNPSDYVGQKVKITVKISSVHEASWLYNNKYYFAYSNDEYDMYLGDRYAIIDKRYDNSLKLLDEDIILVYGEIAEPEETKSYIVNSEELFTIDMRYVELLGE